MENTLQCPKCKTPLISALKDGANVESCPKCEGVWVEFMDEKIILAVKPECLTIDEIRRLRRHYQPMAKQETVRYFPCPICGDLMSRRNWGSHSGVIVDRCENHGTWYDKGEIDQIRHFIEQGGIDYEKIKHSEKEITRIESKLQAETLRLDKKTDSMYRRARLWSMIGF